MASIEGRDISRSFGGVQALKAASFSADPGEVHAIVGENGAGKSTMIKILSGLFAADKGEIHIHGHTVILESPQAALRLGVGTIFQELTLLPYMTVAENLLMGREPRKFGFIDRKATIVAAWKLLQDADISGIEPLELVANLSLGQRQMVEIVKVISRQPQILIMDEPTSALAEHEVEWLFGTIRKLRAQGTCIIFTSHRWNEIKGIADRITVFRNGESVGTYEAADLSEQDAVERMTGRKLEMFYTEPSPLTAQTIALQARQLVGQGLHEVSLTAYRGEVLGIGGLAGQGQRELLLSLFGVNHLKSGSIEIEGQGQRITSPRDAIRKGIALIPEDRKTEGLLLPLPLRQNLTLPILNKISRGGFIQRNQEQSLINTMVSQLAIRTPDAEQPVGALSGGNQQKVLLGRWLLTQARILLFYDVTRGVDVATKHEIYELIRRLSEEGHTILFYSTDTEEIAHICHRVLVMREGRVIAEIIGPHIAPEALVAAAIHIPAAEQANVEVSS
ncbi:MAG TPA: sugar ABC transporter ATP-binding protein [Ktedonobacteraceae bacterium]|jgi:ribose transport system ATP-binding protein|nr:sugar ABC transporter ATP-binding protein [Ktedonobacteraceae bacterium]